MSKRHVAWLCGWWVGLLGAGAEGSEQNPAGKPSLVLVRAGVLIDTVAGEARSEQDILIEGERINAGSAACSARLATRRRSA